MAAVGSDRSLEGKGALVTGASRGIGRAIARALSRRGARLVLASRGGADLREAAGETGGAPVPANLLRGAQVERLVSETLRRLDGAPEILVNNAGIFGLAPATETEPEEFEAHLAVNLVAPFRLSRAFLPRMIERGSGDLVHIGSVAGREPFPENVAYGASKHGLRGLHGVLRLELEGKGVRTHLVEPGPVDTSAWDGLEERLGVDLPPREAMLSPEEVAEAVVERLEAGAGSGELALPAE